ncbi:lipid-A-disaccharide synthase [Mangrovibacterium marinum]|uniref:Lipid-A-disaccharide synthase n=1 Tax=Mangrovibacterium marinum TaxID=1639118 RepID=A0A2T5C521_9BACT|nr:lipid-A-disaccharide synthase [Mangrovibacterium marinum]PTN09951.1 lipid-A-disaccharide synthase [Mangrovibacterium marinum]
MKYFFIAGEASGDLHAANLIRELVQTDPTAEIRGFGGDLMEEAGMKLYKHYREMAFMGFIPVLMHLQTIRKNFRLCEDRLLEFNPDVLILVDYPGFNLRIAEFAKLVGIRVYYYISPKVWAWKEGRVKKIRQLVDEMFTIFPFETEFYASHDYHRVNFVGNPIMDAVEEHKVTKTTEQFCRENNLTDKPILALVPGSRMQEIKSLLPRMLKAVNSINSHQVVVTAAPGIPDHVYIGLVSGYHVNVLRDKTNELLQMSDVAVVASGTVTLEAAIVGCPQVVCYRMAGGALFFGIGKFFLHIKWVSLVNIILQRTAVKELLQHNCTAGNIRKELQRILGDTEYRRQIEASYRELRKKLGGPGASKRAAQLIVQKLRS